MIQLKTQPRRPRRRFSLWDLLWVLPIVVVALVGERLRGQWALERWKGKMAASGEIFDVKRLWPAADVRSVAFSNQFARAVGDLPQPLKLLGGSISTMVVEEGGKCRRGSQEIQPRMLYSKDSTNTWQELDELLRHNQPSLQLVRELMKDPPATMSLDIVKGLEDGSWPNFVAVRIGAQALQAASLNELHKGDLNTALQDIEALLSFAKLYEADPTLVNYMIRIAILGLSTDVCWDALQAEGWTEAQLAELQQACPDPMRLLSQMPRTLEAERVHRIYELKWFRSHSYQAWINRNAGVYESFGYKPPSADTAAVVRNWRQWFYHPLWSFAWADQEELYFLQPNNWT